jgi:hypothetical protein
LLGADVDPDAGIRASDPIESSGSFDVKT